MTPLTCLGAFLTIVFISVAFFNYLSSYPIHYVDLGVDRLTWEKKRLKRLTLSVTLICVSGIMSYIGTL